MLQVLYPLATIFLGSLCMVILRVMLDKEIKDRADYAIAIGYMVFGGVLFQAITSLLTK